MNIVLYQPDIPQNTGTILRMAACLGLGAEIIEPCGFLLDDRRFRRAVLGYMPAERIVRHTGWTAFMESRAGENRAGDSGRLVLLTTQAGTPYTDFAFAPDDTLILGRESEGAPRAVHQAADARVTIPMKAGTRSLNVAVAAAMVVGEALRQTGGFPA